MHLKCVTIQMKTFSLLSTIVSYHNLDVFNLNWNLPAIYYNSDLQDLSAFLPDSKLNATLITTILWARTSGIGAPWTITLPYFLSFSFFTVFGRKSTLFFIWHDPFSFACPLTGLPQLLLFKKNLMLNAAWCFWQGASKFSHLASCFTILTKIKLFLLQQSFCFLVSCDTQNAIRTDKPSYSLKTWHVSSSLLSVVFSVEQYSVTKNKRNVSVW